jgi:hypothetical protein
VTEAFKADSLKEPNPHFLGKTERHCRRTMATALPVLGPGPDLVTSTGATRQWGEFKPSGKFL